MSLGPEETLQSVHLVPYLDICVKQKRLRYTHVPNGGKRPISVAKQMKALGQKKGFPDFIIMSDGFVGFVEVKRPRIRDLETGRLSPKGVMSDEQKEWRDYFQAHDLPWALVESLEDLAETLREWKLI